MLARPNSQLATLFLVCLLPGYVIAGESIPDKLVVLTFDDSAKSHFTVARPLLKDYGFGATFFITEGFDFKENKKDYMTWEEITQLHRDGFEIGNHTRDHMGISDKKVDRLPEQLKGINDQCAKHGIPQPVTFAWPGNQTSQQAFSVLQKHGIKFARRGGAPEYPYDKGRGFAFEPGKDHALLLPSVGDARPDWSLGDFIRAVQQAKDGKIAILQFHGVPDTAHSWVNSPQAQFEAYMKYLSLNDYKVIALRDLEKYVDHAVMPADPNQIIEDRQRAVAREMANASSQATVSMLSRAHAHNDYLHDRPLLDALDNGFCSVEADIYLVEGELLVAHTFIELRKENTLQKLYLDPLQERVKQNNGRVYPGGPEFTLLIDIKNHGAETFSALNQLLARYPDVFSSVENEQLKPRAVRAVVSGDRAFDVIAKTTPRYAGIDGRLVDLGSKQSPDLMPLISDNWNRHFKWRGKGQMPESEFKLLKATVEKTHAAGRKIRFWATPDEAATWKILNEAGVDLINTDDLQGLRKFLMQAEKK